MDWSPQQQTALDLVADWVRHQRQAKAGYPEKPSQVFRLFGYAGTGKTTLARHFARGVRGEVLFGAFTGKAALVLRRKGAAAADTIHRLIYKPHDKNSERLKLLRTTYEKALKDKKYPEDRLRKLAREIALEEDAMKQPHFRINECSEVPEAALVIIDEVSMVGERMGVDLLSFGTPVLVLGDPAQLPPVGDGGFFTNAEPDVMLTEIHRQAAQSPVVELATRVRLGQSVAQGEYGTSAVVPKGVLKLSDLFAHDIILCGLNRTRRMLNQRIRKELLGRESHLPEEKDRLVCLRNNHDLGLLNGSIWTVLDSVVLDDDTMGLTLKGEQDEEVTTECHRHTFEGRDIPYFDQRKADSFDFGYVLTCHKAQGSQWDRVVVLDESRMFRAHQKNWIYTAITRAAESVTVVVP